MSVVWKLNGNQAYAAWDGEKRVAAVQRVWHPRTPPWFWMDLRPSFSLGARSGHASTLAEAKAAAERRLTE